MFECRAFRVTGRVQGVGFRAGARQQAQRLGLTGWIRNCADGSVEGVACGPCAALDRLRAWLARGPGPARVDQVRMRQHSGPAPATFEIR